MLRKVVLETTANSITAQVESVSTTANSAVTAASKAQQTADAINVNLTKNYQTKENADNIYATKASLTATSESLSTSITKAQQTADGAVNAASNAQQTADAININLTKNYQTTKDADDKYATQTSLNATADSITSTVSKTYATKTEVTSAIDGISIGGRNMLRGSSFKGLPQVDNTYQKFKNNSVKLICDNTNGTSTKYVTISSLQQSWVLSDVIGKTITISMWIYIEEVGQLYGYEFRIVYSDNGTKYWFNPDDNYPYYIPNAMKLKQGWNYVYGSFTIPISATEAYFNFTCYSEVGRSGLAWFSSPKAEIGNKATAWTPAPEDVDASINSLANTVETTYSTKSEVKQLSDQISSTVTEVTTVKNDLSAAKKVADDAASAASKAQQTATEAKSNAATAQSTADTAKANAAAAQSKANEAAKNLATAEENLKNLQNQADATDEQVAAAQTAVANAKKAADAAQADATTAKNAAATAQDTADTAKSNAATAQATADTAKANAKTAQDDVNALKNRVTAAETSIKQNSDAITLRATKTEVTSAINGISVGGKNLLLGTAKFETSDTGYALSLVKDSTVLFKNNYTAYGNRAWLSYAIYLYYLKDRCGIKVGDTLTYSIYFMFTTNEPKDTDKKRILLRWYTTKGGPTNASVITELNLDTDSDVWRQYSYTFVVSETMLKPYVPIRFECDYYTESDYTSPRLTQWWSSPKLELGNKSTDWSPAPEDLIAESKTYTDAQLKVSADSITSTVSKTYATKTSVDTLQNIADNAIESWYLVGVPSGTNKPASDWTTDTLKKQHVGDMYYDKDTGYSYRWLQEGTAYKWVQIKDNDITNANVVANEAKSTAKSAESTANTAKTTADNASATASAASTTANGAAKDRRGCSDCCRRRYEEPFG